MAIQSAINSMLGSTSRAVMAVKGYRAMKAKRTAQMEKQQQKKNKVSTSTASPQSMAAQQAKQSAKNAIEAKKDQKRSFRDYLGRQESSLGPIGKLPDALQKQIAAQFTGSQRRKMMDQMDMEGSNGKHKQRNSAT